jgi:uncharacterized protein YndB with AHSA1/START domain
MSVGEPGEPQAFVYTNYIEATPEQVWQGLTDPALTKRYWRHATAGGKSFPFALEEGFDLRIGPRGGRSRR